MGGPASTGVTLDSGRLTVCGEMSFASVLGLLEQTRGLMADGHGPLEIDLAEVGRVDSAGLALMIEWLRMARQSGRELSFLNLPAQLQAIAEASDLDGVLPVGEIVKGRG